MSCLICILLFSKCGLRFYCIGLNIFNFHEGLVEKTGLKMLGFDHIRFTVNSDTCCDGAGRGEGILLQRPTASIQNGYYSEDRVSEWKLYPFDGGLLPTLTALV